MSLTPGGKRCFSAMETQLKPSSSNTPVFDGHFDRFCTKCGFVMEKAALWKYYGQCCPHCNGPVDGRKAEQRNWDNCLNCDSVIMCFMKVCKNCGFVNKLFDPDKPARFERILKSKIMREVRAKLEEEDQKILNAADVLIASQSSSLNASILENSGDPFDDVKAADNGSHDNVKETAGNSTEENEPTPP